MQNISNRDLGGKSDPINHVDYKVCRVVTLYLRLTSSKLFRWNNWNEKSTTLFVRGGSHCQREDSHSHNRRVSLSIFLREIFYGQRSIF